MRICPCFMKGFEMKKVFALLVLFGVLAPSIGCDKKKDTTPSTTTTAPPSTTTTVDSSAPTATTTTK